MNGFKSREMFCSVLEFREEKRIFAKIEGGNMDFFHELIFVCSLGQKQK
jgi:hypothetical protein